MEESNKILVPLYAVEECVDCKELLQKLAEEGRHDLPFGEADPAPSVFCPHPLVCYFHEQHRILMEGNRRQETGIDPDKQNQIIQEAKRRIAEHFMTGGFVPNDWDDPSDNIDRAIKDYMEML